MKIRNLLYKYNKEKLKNLNIVILINNRKILTIKLEDIFMLSYFDFYDQFINDYYIKSNSIYINYIDN